MALSSIFILLGIFLLAGVIIIRPLFVESDTGLGSNQGEYDSLLAEKERLLSSIEDLELEYELKKISSKEYTRNRDLLLAEAAEVLKQLDKIAVPLKDAPRTSPATKAGDDLDALIEARRRELAGEKSSGCPHCGKNVKADDQFCSHCGKEL
jgi:hypothetical protein